MLRLGVGGLADGNGDHKAVIFGEAERFFDFGGAFALKREARKPQNDAAQPHAFGGEDDVLRGDAAIDARPFVILGA